MRVVLTAACLALLPTLVAAQTPSANREAWEAVAASGRLAEMRELMLWDAVRDSRDPAALEEYLRHYPDGTFARIAKLRIEGMIGPPAAEPAPTPSEGTAAASAIVKSPLPPLAGPDAGASQPALVVQRLPDGASFAAYDRAFAVLRAAEYDEAAALLRGFIDAYPADPLVANAQYWLGEISMVRGDYAQAAGRFGDALRTQPDGAKAADALFKLATALGRDGQGQEACGAFARLAREHPTAATRYGATLIAERRRLGC
jgi:tol-pal system protein YbgF